MLSSREKQVYELKVQGLSDFEIAKKLKIAVSTVKTHTLHIHQILGICGNSAIIRHAYQSLKKKYDSLV